MKNKPHLSMFQLIADHNERKVNQYFMGTREDLFLMFGVAFSSDPELYRDLKKIIELYEEFINED